MEYGVIAFASTHAAIQTEKRLKLRFAIMIMPTPRSITASCGISIRFAPHDREGISEALAEVDLERSNYAVYGIYTDGSLVRFG